ncbi:MAG: hypothetical protein QXW10_03905, partial [Candidatus Micrarchaeaceae archaeon]
MLAIIAMIPILLSFNAVYVLIPILIIVILIAAAAGLTRGTDIFALLGFGTIMGFTSGMGAGRVKGLAGRKYGSGGAAGAARIKKRAAQKKKGGAAGKMNGKKKGKGGPAVKGATKFGAIGGALAMRKAVKAKMLEKVGKGGSVLKAPSSNPPPPKKMRFATRFGRVARGNRAGQKAVSLRTKAGTYGTRANNLMDKTGKTGVMPSKASDNVPRRIGYSNGLLYLGRTGKFRVWIPGAATAGAVIGGAVGLGSAIRYRGRVRLSKEERGKIPAYDDKGNKLRPLSKNERRELKSMKLEKIKGLYTTKAENKELKEYKLAVVGVKRYRQEKREIKREIKENKINEFIGSPATKQLANSVAGGLSSRTLSKIHKNGSVLSSPETEDFAAKQYAEGKLRRMKQIGDRYGTIAATTYAFTNFTLPTLRNAWRHRGDWKTSSSVLQNPGSSPNGAKGGGAGTGGGSAGGSASGGASSGMISNPSGDKTRSEQRSSRRINEFKEHNESLNEQKDNLNKEVQERAGNVAYGSTGSKIWNSIALGFTGDRMRNVNGRIKKTNDLIKAEEEKSAR